MESKDKQTLSEQIQQEIKNEKVIIFSKSFCPYCQDAKSLLTNGKIFFKVYELDKMKNGSEIQKILT